MVNYKELKCPICLNPIQLVPESTDDKGDILFSFLCLDHGVVDIKSTNIIFYNWENGYVNVDFHKTIVDYIDLITHCDTPCMGCKWRDKCYNNFFIEVDKEKLENEIIKE